MPTQNAILEQWFARAIEAYPAEAAGLLVLEKDPFRNPVGHTLRENLAILLQEVLGLMDTARVSAALENILRIRAVQDMSASQAVAFVFQLRAILRDLEPQASLLVLNDRIDQLALLAFEEYTRRREQVAELRITEGLRSMRRPSALRRERS
jgi:hypothetical protein